MSYRTQPLDTLGSIEVKVGQVIIFWMPPDLLNATAPSWPLGLSARKTLREYERSCWHSRSRTAGGRNGETPGRRNKAALATRGGPSSNMDLPSTIYDCPSAMRRQERNILSPASSSRLEQRHTHNSGKIKWRPTITVWPSSASLTADQKTSPGFG